MPSVTTQWRVLQSQQSSGCVVGYRPAGMVEPTPLGYGWSMAGVWFESAAETQGIRDATRISLRVGHSRQLRHSGRRGALRVEHRLAVLEMSQNHEAAGRGR